MSGSHCLLLSFHKRSPSLFLADSPGRRAGAEMVQLGKLRGQWARVPETQTPSWSWYLRSLRDLSWCCVEKRATMCQVEMDSTTAGLVEILGAGPGESSWQGSAGKGVLGPPGSGFKGKAPAGEQAQPGLWRVSGVEWGSGSSQEHLEVQGKGWGRRLRPLPCPPCQG